MNLTVILTVVACLQVSAHAYSQQTITLSQKDASLETVFKEIKKQTGYNFFCKYEWLQQAKKVNIEVRNASLEQVLELCFKDQPLTYTIVNRTIMVKPREEEKEDHASLPVDIKGKVTNDKGEPLPGATVIVKGSSKGVVTDANGLFELKGVDAGVLILASFTGYATREIKVKGSGFIQVSLSLNTSSLDETVVIAYGTTTKRMNTGNVSTVKAEDIEKQPVNNPLLALEGRVPGLFITQSSGLAGSGVTVRIQGLNSISNGNDPLYVIDGVPYASQLLPNQGTILGNSGTTVSGNPLSFLNPQDIESIEVLKDADATAIYGSRAANGAILITTKKGKPSQTKLDLNIQNGWGKITRKLDLLNTRQYLEMRREAYINDNLTPTTSSAPDLLFWDTTRYTDWQKKLIGGTAHYFDGQTTISGGTSNVQYLIGGNYHRETTVFPGDFSDQRASFHFSINSISANQKFRIQVSGNYLSDNNHLPGQDFTQTAIQLAPDAPPVYNADGSLNWAPLATGLPGTWTNPFANLQLKYNSRTSNMVGNAVLSYKLFPGLEIKSSFGYTSTRTDDNQTTPLLYLDPYLWFLGNGLRQAYYSNNSMRTWIIEPQAEYKKRIGDGQLNVLIGATAQQSNNDGNIIYGSGYNNDLVLNDIKSAASLQVMSSTQTEYKYNAFFGRLNYNLKDKYLINLTARKDGTSRFGPGSQFHDFEAAGIGWIFSKERFVESNIGFLSFGKLKASYGTTGSDQIGDYSFMDLYTPLSVGVPYQGATGMSINQLYNPDLHWEETKKLYAGINLGFLRDRILLEAGYFRNRSSNQLLGYKLPSITGYTSVLQNLPATVQNSGWEFTFNSINIEGKNVYWTTSLNLTIPRNKLISFPNIEGSGFGGKVGQPISSIPVYHYIGVDSATGIYQFSDSHGNPTSNPGSSDATVFINTAPKFFGGIQNSLSYHHFQLDFLFQFVKQEGQNYAFGSYPGTPSGNQPVWVLDRWKEHGDIAGIQRFNASGSLSSAFRNIVSSDAGYSDASYIRLKNLSLSWQLPEQWKQKIGLKNFRAYVQGQNLLTITHFKGLDPENMSIRSLPMLKVLTVGVQASF